MTVDFAKVVVDNVNHAKIVIHDEVITYIAGLSPEHQQYFIDQFSARPNGYFFNPLFKLGVWDGYVRYFNDKGKTYTSLLDDIIPQIVKFGYRISVDDRRESAENSFYTAIDRACVTEDYFAQYPDPKHPELPFTIRNYQVESVQQLVEFGNGVLEAGTGAGKTTICALISSLYEKHGSLRSIVIVPNKSLITQTAKTYRFLGLDCGEFGGGVHDPNHQHVISTWQTLKGQPHILKSFQVMIIDECHGIRGNVMTKLANEAGKHIIHRFGVTGTIPDNAADALAVRVAVGPCRYKITASQLIDDGWLAKPNISVIQLNDQQILDEAFDGTDYELPDWDSEKRFLHTSKRRLETVVDLINTKRETSNNGNLLFIVPNVSVGKKLHKLVKGSHFLYGKHVEEEREAVYNLFENNDGLVVFATVGIAGVGLSIDRIFNLFLLDLGKSYIRVIQAIGRGLRKSDDKDEVDIIDVCSDLKYAKLHTQKRIKYYKQAKYPYKLIKLKYE